MNFEKKYLGEIVNLKRGYDLPSQHRKQGIVPIISSSGITDYHSEPAKTGEGVVTGRYGTLGQLFYINGDYWPLNTTLYVQDFKGNSPKFIYYFLKTLSIEKFNAASAVPGLDRNVLHKIAVNFISHLPTQRKIASILSAYDDLIENNLKRIKLLEEKARLIYKLIQKDILHAEKINLYEFAYIQMGFAFKAEAFNENGEGIPIIRIRDIPSQKTKSYTTQEVDNQYWVEKGDLLIGMDGEFHMNEWLGQRGYLVQRVCRLRAKMNSIKVICGKHLKRQFTIMKPPSQVLLLPIWVKSTWKKYSLLNPKNLSKVN
ncbi:MAG: restriction endonuclease subunit S [Saprospiraceae bacterium]|nr:restriction endonuclease subunit S [Saprospiraceae bacterium]